MDEQYVLCIDRAKNWQQIQIGKIYKNLGIKKYKGYGDCYILNTLDNKHVPESYIWQFIEISEHLINKPLLKLVSKLY